MYIWLISLRSGRKINSKGNYFNHYFKYIKQGNVLLNTII